MEHFNANSWIFYFVALSRSGGVGINLTSADAVIFYDSNFNPQIDHQCEYRFISSTLMGKSPSKYDFVLVLLKGESDGLTNISASISDQGYQR
ncbi:uncharacterized protein ARMOST_00554 [Armillaria ostoyae]|uniref:Helicase C-terminal domain-containing protein n=1 Tax=Armillaria ostoyae TaxID=47428 RepID=A0A284QLH5_ARMOS|nr:uncharacterized protein ARMOST_00554 [Armillaria ostoyae]